MSESNAMRGVVHGKTIQLDQAPDFPEGQLVNVVVRPVDSDRMEGEGLQKAFGGWADESEDLDKYLEWSRSRRKLGRPGTPS